MIKKHSLPSETEFFLNKEGDINPHPQGQRDKETVPSVRTKGAYLKTSYPVTQHLHQQLRQSASREAPPQGQRDKETVPSVRTKGGYLMTSYPVTQHLHQQLRQSASSEAPQDDFLVSDVTKDEEIFFQGFQTSPDQEGLTFFWLQTSPRDDSPRSQTSPQKSLSRLDVSKKNLNFFCDKNLKNMKIVSELLSMLYERNSHEKPHVSI